MKTNSTSFAVLTGLPVKVVEWFLQRLFRKFLKKPTVISVLNCGAEKLCK